MSAAISRRMGVCCECQSMAPVRLSNQARALRLGHDDFDLPPTSSFLMEAHRVGGGEVGEPCNGVATVPQALVPLSTSK